MNGFVYRALVAMANRARVTNEIGALADPLAASAKRVTTSVQLVDVSDSTLSVFNQLDQPHAPSDRLMLTAFWHEHAPAFTTHPSESRLLVNPPPGLVLDAMGTLDQPNLLGGLYGVQVSCTAVPLQRLATSAKFDELMVFWDRDVPSLAELVEPGSTLVLVHPNEYLHRLWLDWVGFDTNFKAVVAALGTVFKLALLHVHHGGEVTTKIYGLSAR